MTYFSAIMPVTDGMGLVFAVTSHEGRIVISPTSCREIVPEPELLSQCIRDEFQEYLALARRQARLKKARRRRAAKPHVRRKSAGKRAASRR